MTSGPAIPARATGLRRTLAVALVANLGVAGAKLLYGELSGSMAMGADGLHSLLDAGASAAGLVGVTLATRPPDPGHPYGYERYESLTALIIGAFLVLALLRILGGAVARILAPVPATVTWMSFAIMGSPWPSAAVLRGGSDARLRRWPANCSVPMPCIRSAMS